MTVVRILITAAATLLGLAFVLATRFVRHPGAMAWRPSLYVASAGIAFVLLLAAAWSLRGGRRIAAAMLAALAVAGGGSVLGQEWAFARLKARVLDAPEAELRAVGRHLMVGYGDVGDLRPLVTKAAVAGVFVAKRNAEHSDASGLAGDIAFLQDLRGRAGLPPLWIAADQEGGTVASLSPPLPRPPALATLARDKEALRESATEQARDLACLGVNLNFAPVVDLRGASDPADRYSRIAARSISDDPAVVVDTARSYCLGREGVGCTLKHFPGLGRTAADTHVRAAVLPDLAEADLRPFRELTRTPARPPWIMLSHAGVASLDAARPASASDAVIGILRRGWGFDGILVTDDAWMAPYRARLEDHLVESLNGGADVILIAYDPDLAYTALDALLRAHRAGRIVEAALGASELRLAALRPPGRALGCPSTARFARAS